jgi:hypothetical protein
MIYSLVPMSGPKQSMPAPMNPFLINSMVYLLVALSNSALLNFLGSILIPPFAPPKGMSAIASLNVIRDANASVSYNMVNGGRDIYLEIHVWRIPGASLHWQSVVRMLGSVAGNCVNGTVVSSKRDVESNDCVARLDQRQILL